MAVSRSTASPPVWGAARAKRLSQSDRSQSSWRVEEITDVRGTYGSRPDFGAKAERSSYTGSPPDWTILCGKSFVGDRLVIARKAHCS
jgi:hypothetical protein